MSLQLTARTDALEGIIPSGPRITPEQLRTGDQSTRGFLLEGESEYNPQDQQYVSHFLGVVTGPDKITRPDDKGFLVLNQHPVRVLFRDVRAEVRLDTLDDLITQMKRVTNNIYKINTARLSGGATAYVADKIIAIDDDIALMNQIYRLLSCQYNQRKAETGHSNKAEKLLTELKFFVDDKDDKGYVGYLRLVREQRNEGLEYVRMDEAVFAQYAAQFLREIEVTPMPADIPITDLQDLKPLRCTE